MTNLKRARINAGLTQAQLAEISGLNLRTIQSLEQGYKNINHAAVENVLKLAKALNCEVQALIEYEDKHISPSVAEGATNYKAYDTTYIGSSDVAALTLTGCTDDGLIAEVLQFDQKGSYRAYIVPADTIIGEHYTLKYTFNSWLKIYDDSGLSAQFTGSTINIYRDDSEECIVQVVE